MKNIGFILREITLGGLENLVLDLSEQFQTKDAIIHIICTEGTRNNWDIEVNDGITVKIFNCWECDDLFKYLYEMKDYIDSLNLDCVYVNDSIYGNSLLSLIKTKTKKITVLHSILDTCKNIALSNKDYIDGIIAVSPATYKKLNRNDNINKVMIMNGIDFPNVIEKKCINNEALQLLYSGRIADKDKGVFSLVDIVERLHLNSDISFNLKLVGDGPDRKKLECLFKERRLLHLVDFLGYLPKSELNNQYQISDILLFPSKHEAFGLSIVEAQYFGCIPMATRIEGATDQIISDGINGFLIDKDENEAENYVKVIKELYDNVSYRTRLSKCAQKNAQRFSIKSTADQWLEFADSVEQELVVVDSKKNILDSIECLSTHTDINIFKQKNMFLQKYYNKNIQLNKFKGKKIAIFGTLHMAYYLYTLFNPISEIKGFIDNNSVKESINNIKVYKENRLIELGLDYILISVESNSSIFIKERLSRDFEIETITWKELM
ncbi:glycosyltransferase family 4 protein [Lysinibacillus pakistanensis]|uniref:Glycosyltransferase n=1 Tax=Lysinibacillus pakistanensis TaxID=759811 RepID=A0ABX6DAM4_9BACI|nr:glycosyltransferase [Lysinibacillus pakistanensis]